MTEIRLEHINVTVADPDEAAAIFVRMFGWRVRWEGESIHGGRSVHVGGDHSYIALYRATEDQASAPNSYRTSQGLNHIGVLVDDIDATEAAVRKEGYTPGERHVYDPGERFYFDGPDGIEVEVVSYA